MPMREDRTTGQPLAYPEASFNQPNKPISLRRGKHSLKFVDPHSSEKCGVSAEIQEMESENEMGGLLNADVLHTKKSPSAKELTERSTQTTRLETKQMKGALPDGVFDNKEMIYVPVGTLSDQGLPYKHFCCDG